MKATDKVTITIEAGTLLAIYNSTRRDRNCERTVWNKLRKAMFPVMISDSNGFYSRFKFEDSSIKLNDELSAEILDGKVKVGCQEFTFDAIKKLNKAIKKATS